MSAQRVMVFVVAVVVAVAALAVVTWAGDPEPPRGEVTGTMLTLEELGQRLDAIQAELDADCSCDCPTVQTYLDSLDEDDINLYTGTRHVESLVIGLRRVNSASAANLEVYAGSTLLFETLLQRGEAKAFPIGANLSDLRVYHPGTVPVNVRAMLVSCTP